MNDDANAEPVVSQYRRAHYRLPYPATERPSFLAACGVFPVVELSEVSARILPAGAIPATGDEMDGIIALPSGVECQVDGIAVRASDDEVIVWFGTGITMKTIVSEQRRLMATHPEYLPRPSRPG